MEEFDCWIQILALRGQHLNVGYPTTSSGSSKGFDGVFEKNHARGQAFTSHKYVTSGRLFIPRCDKRERRGILVTLVPNFRLKTSCTTTEEFVQIHLQ